MQDEIREHGNCISNALGVQRERKRERLEICLKDGEKLHEVDVAERGYKKMREILQLGLKG